VIAGALIAGAVYFPADKTFNACLTSGKYDKHIQTEINSAVATGGNGTPWSIVVAKNGKTSSGMNNEGYPPPIY